MIPVYVYDGYEDEWYFLCEAEPGALRAIVDSIQRNGWMGESVDADPGYSFSPDRRACYQIAVSPL